MPIDPSLVEALDALVAEADPAMWIVTATAPALGAGHTVERSGCLIGFATQASIEPWRFVACLSTENHTFGVAQRATHLVVHAVATQHAALARRFGTLTGDETDKLAGVDWHEGPEGTTVLDGLPALVGRIVERVSFGDHVGHVLEPVAVVGPDPDRGTRLRLHDAIDWPPGHPRDTDEGP